MNLQQFKELITSRKSYLSRLPKDIIEFFLLNYLTVSINNIHLLFGQFHSPRTIQRSGSEYIIHALPAVSLKNGIKYWFQQQYGFHRDNDLPAIINKDGTEEYYKNGVKYTPAKKRITEHPLSNK